MAILRNNCSSSFEALSYTTYLPTAIIPSSSSCQKWKWSKLRGFRIRRHDRKVKSSYWTKPLISLLSIICDPKLDVMRLAVHLGVCSVLMGHSTNRVVLAYLYNRCIRAKIRQKSNSNNNNTKQKQARPNIFLYQDYRKFRSSAERFFG
jgi:hypothetical protein